jgi:uncharacterized protein YcbK (DUF882 family)
MALMAVVGASDITASYGKSRTIALYNIHSKETLSILYKKDGQYIPAAMEKINWIMRDWRKDETTKMDPALIDLLFEMHTELGSKEPIHIISAFRSRGTNDMLRKTVGGQASESRHIVGQAADVHFPDVPLKNLRYSALIREKGGVGYYPTSALPFVHVDTDRVRHWPRLPRYELALLFPNGKTQHQPADGDAITMDDVRIAQSKHRELAVQVAEFQTLRTTSQQPIAVAALEPPKTRAPAPIAASIAAAPPVEPRPEQRVAALTPPRAASPLPTLQLVESPRVVDRPSQLTAVPRPSESDRKKLTELAAFASAASFPQLVIGPAPAARRPTEAPQLANLTGAGPTAAVLPRTTAPAAPAPRVAAVDPRVSNAGPPRMSDISIGSGFVQAPAFDEEHPEELSYRPFPIAPLLTLTASADDPALVRMQHPDVAKTLELLDTASGMPPMRLRPGQQVAQIMWAQQFKGEAVNLNAMTEDPSSARSGLQNRKVSTSKN